MAATQHRLSLPVVGPKIEDLLLWRDIKRSGIVFGGITAVYLLVGLSDLDFVPLVLRGVSYVALLAMAWHTVAGFFGRSGPPVPPIFASGYTEESFGQLAASARPHVNTALNFLGVVLSGNNPKLSLQVFAAAFMASYILAVVPMLSLAYIVVLLAFTVPKLYELRKDDADKYIGQAQGKYNELYAKLDESVLQKLPKPTPKKAQ